MSDTCPECGRETDGGAYCVHCGVHCDAYIPTYDELYRENNALKTELLSYQARFGLLGKGDNNG